MPMPEVVGMNGSSVTAMAFVVLMLAVAIMPTNDADYDRNDSCDSRVFVLWLCTCYMAWFAIYAYA